MSRLPIFALFGVLMVAVGAAGAQDIDKGYEALRRGDYTAALAEIKPLAEQGHAGAQYNLAKLYDEGRGVPRDGEQAAAWYLRAAEAGSWIAAFDLGMLYWGQSQAAGVMDGASNDALVRVHMWFGIAAAMEVVGCVAIGAPLRDVVAQSMTAEQIAGAQELTHIWLAAHPSKDVNVASAKWGC